HHPSPQLFFEFRHARQSLVSLPGLEMIDAGGVERFAGRQLALHLLLPALLKPRRKARFAAQAVSFKLAGDAVAPAGGDFVDGEVLAAGGVAVDGVRGHRHWTSSGMSRARSRRMNDFNAFRRASLAAYFVRGSLIRLERNRVAVDLGDRVHGGF